MIERLKGRFEKVAEIAKCHDRIHLFSHYDADGIASASVVASSLRRSGIEFDVTIFPTLEPKQMEKVRDTEFECMIMTDMGTSYLNELGELGKDCIILDHHEPLTDTDLNHVAYINCHNAGIDGSHEVCASTMAYLFAQAMGDNKDLVEIAIAGMIGDKQHIGGFKGVNKGIIDSAIEDGRIICQDDSLIPSGDITHSLYESIDPFIKGISGDITGVKELLASLNIVDLSDQIEKKRLEYEVLGRLRSQGVSDHIIDQCIQPRYHLPTYGMDAERLSRIIDACGRSEKGDAGIDLCLDGKSPIAESTYMKYTERLLRCADDLSKSGTIVMENIQFFINTVSGVTGTVAGMYSRYLGDPMKPIVGFQPEGKKYSLSSRCTDLALDKGVNMAAAMRECTRAVGGNGGGHANAAGGSIHKEKKDEFLKLLNETIGKQIS